MNKITVLDWDTVSTGDISEDEIFSDGNITFYGLTTAEQTAGRIADSNIVLCNKVLITREIIESCPDLKYIGLFATGFNNIDIKAAKDHGITVCNAGSYSTNAVAQHTFALILQHYSKVSLYREYTESGKWITSPTFSAFPYPMYELAGRTIAVVGFGSIGKAVAKIADAFGMNVIVNTRTKPENCSYELVSLDDAFRRADIITFHCPLTEATKGAISRERIALMKEDAIIINTSRGPVADEQALADALNSGRIAGAGLDVLGYEPMRKDCPLYGAKKLHHHSARCLGSS
ncbi:D-2-hydroxyacid dehydrogenase [Ruminococcus sp. HUN007]|uniref:D-2-hydroxyacid dehydrogenase n=1 Tax=Ruminococcus sp. HUN007 TaxID=1514668 RepID=UPI000ABFD7A0|nr:D-2-hydroxyacid dehydrogenase [Ruminococcus sp. HUN007]